jgi:hypothetical protein
MDSKQLFIQLAIWPNIAWIGGILIAMMWSHFDSIWDEEFATPFASQETHVIPRIAITATDPTETSGK